MLLVRIGFCTTKSDIRKYWCFAYFLSHAQMFKLTKHSFPNSIRIWSGSELWQRFFSSFLRERIQITQKAGHHRPASETHLNGVSLACRWWPNVECWLGNFENFRGSGPVLLRNSIFLWFFRWGWGVRTPCPPSGSAHGTGLCLHLLRYTENPFYRAYRLLYDTLHTFCRSTNRERERCVFFLKFVIF